ncbi:hypothetical protein CRENPOLYSF2_1130009 [Crenothrix polyspora]|uniref:Uncharacterized protein n=1 Tax=Crenothrix polyspora TaxID=360316 RepID=A0A1R4GZD6_9GAMM|nr:hypothetical protein CRENPOLYSF2_1130009 [Crenothrix polyspora]
MESNSNRNIVLIFYLSRVFNWLNVLVNQCGIPTFSAQSQIPKFNN